MFCLAALLWLGLAGSPAGLAESRIALVVGNSNYENTRRLANPANDARLIAQTLRSIGFDVDLRLDVPQKDLKRAIVDFGQRVEAGGPAGVALIFYAGHGVQLDGANYLIPIDARIEREADVPIEAVNAGEMLSLLERASAGANVIILDACRDNPFQSSTRSVARGLARMVAPTGSVVAYATSPGSVAADGDGANSPYSAALAEVMTIKGLTLEQMFKRVRVKVHEETGGKQTPWEELSLLMDVYLSPGEAQSATSAPPQTPQSTNVARTECDSDTGFHKALETNTIEAYEAFTRTCPSHAKVAAVRQLIAALSDERMWEDVRRSHTPAAYKRYLIAFPDGIYAAIASEQLKAFEAKQAALTPEPTTSEEPQATTSNELRVFDKYDPYGNDFQRLNDVNLDACFAACNGTSRCRAFTFNTTYKVCFLKESVDRVIPTDNAIGGIRQSDMATTRVGSIVVFANKDVVGQDYRELWSVSFEGCYDACAADGRCQSFTYLRRRSFCSLKNGTDPVIAKRGVELGIKQ